MPREHLIFSRMLGAAERVHAVSEGLREDVIANQMCSEDRIRVIHNLRSSSKIQTLARESVSKFWGNSKLVVSVGRLHKQKNYRILIAAFAIVQSQTDAKLVIIGEGPEREDLESYISQLKLTESVFLPGWRQNPFPYMALCDVFVLSSDYEGLSGVLIEALTCGCNIVSTDCPHGAGEILEYGKYGRLVPVGDAGAMADTIMEALSGNTDQNALLARAAEFSSDKLGPAYASLIEETVENSSLCG